MEPLEPNSPLGLTEALHLTSALEEMEPLGPTEAFEPRWSAEFILPAQRNPGRQEEGTANGERRRNDGTGTDSTRRSGRKGAAAAGRIIRAESRRRGPAPHTVAG